LEGSVRKAANRVRITGQLVDTTTGGHLWADRFDGGLGDIFDLQDQVTERVVGAIAPAVEEAEIERAKHKPTESLDAYDFFLRGLASFHQGTRGANDEALQLFYRAIDLDPDFASALGMVSSCYIWRNWNGWMTDRLQEIAEAIRLAKRAVHLGRDDAVALCTGGFTLAHLGGELDDGAAFIDRALVLNPNFATAWQFSGWVKVWLGDPDGAIERLGRAMRLSPLDPLTFLAQGAMGLAHFAAGRYSEERLWAQRAVREQPNFAPAIRIYAASCALSGQQEDAEKAIARMRQLDPAVRASDIKDRTPFRRAENIAKYEEALRKAGLSD
jgi:tetratricopeptide (TPR) repeat protein